MSDPLDHAAPAARVDLLVIGVLAVVAAGGLLDLAADAPTTWRSAHVLLEVGLSLLSLSVAGWLLHRLRRTRRALARADRDLAALAEAQALWRRDAEAALDDLGRAVGLQFERWGLSPAEREVAMHLLQGTGHRDIATRTGRAERTVRQHAVRVYEKAGVAGRAELAGFFLQGLRTPPAG